MSENQKDKNNKFIYIPSKFTKYNESVRQLDIEEENSEQNDPQEESIQKEELDESQEESVKDEEEYESQKESVKDEEEYKIREESVNEGRKNEDYLKQNDLKEELYGPEYSESDNEEKIYKAERRELTEEDKQIWEALLYGGICDRLKDPELLNYIDKDKIDLFTQLSDMRTNPNGPYAKHDLCNQEEDFDERNRQCPEEFISYVISKLELLYAVYTDKDNNEEVFYDFTREFLEGFIKYKIAVIEKNKRNDIKDEEVKQFCRDNGISLKATSAIKTCLEYQVPHNVILNTYDKYLDEIESVKKAIQDKPKYYGSLSLALDVNNIHSSYFKDLEKNNQEIPKKLLQIDNDELVTRAITQCYIDRTEKNNDDIYTKTKRDNILLNKHHILSNIKNKQNTFHQISFDARQMATSQSNLLHKKYNRLSVFRFLRRHGLAQANLYIAKELLPIHATNSELLNTNSYNEYQTIMARNKSRFAY